MDNLRDEMDMDPTATQDALFVIGALTQEIRRQELRLKHQRRMTLLANATCIMMALASVSYFYHARFLRRSVHELVRDVEAVLVLEKTEANIADKTNQRMQVLEDRIRKLEGDPRSVTLTFSDKTKK